MTMKLLTGAKILSVISILNIGFTSCDSVQQDASRGPIVLGDPATIVTETDTQFLGDIVMDLDEKDPVVPAPAKDTFHNVEAARQLAAQQKKDSIAAAQAAQQKAQEKEAPRKLSRAEQRAQKKKEEEERKKKEEAARKKKQANTRKSGSKKIAQKEPTKRRR